MNNSYTQNLLFWHLIQQERETVIIRCILFVLQLKCNKKKPPPI